MKPAATLRALFVLLALGLSGAANAKVAAAPAADPNETCLMCHTDASAKGASGKSIAVDPAVFGKSVHGEMQFKCTDCHSDVSAEQLPHAEKLKPAACASCHEDAVKHYTTTAHGKARGDGKGLAATCHDCHGAHDIKRSKDKNSRTNFANIEATCGSCHGDDKFVEKAHLPGGNVQAKYHDSIHGKLVDYSGGVEGVAPTCTSCHGTHNIEAKSQPGSRVARAHIPDTCGGCHQRIKTVYDKGRHGKLRHEGNAAAPICIDCHSAHTIQQVALPKWQLAVIGQCGNCHSDLITTYRSTFHGQVTELGYANVATCAACHGAHDVLPASDPASRVSAANRVDTCRSCHPKATVSFAQFDPHANRRDKERSPLFYYAALSMDLLLLGVFAFFGIHTVLWLQRSLRLLREQRRSSAGKDG